MTEMTKVSETFTIGGDVTVNRMGFGAMRITGAGIWGEPADHDEAIRVLKRTLELGVNFIDTADSYGPEVSERLIAEALYPYPRHLVIATKAGLVRPGPDHKLIVPEGMELAAQRENVARVVIDHGGEIANAKSQIAAELPEWRAAQGDSDAKE